MPRLSRLLIHFACLSLASAAMLSAYGFHGLPGKVPDAKIASWAWANQFQFYHSIGIVIVALLLRRQPRSAPLLGAVALMIVGLVLFSGSIYAEVLGAPAAIGEVAPLGGSAFMLAWLLAGIGAWRLRE